MTLLILIVLIMELVNMTKPKILSVIIIYNPDLDLLKRNIDALINHVDNLVIWNNSPEKFKEDLISSDGAGRLLFFSEGSNLGISKALNTVWHYAQQNGYDYLLTMDQDSVWVNLEGFLERVFSFKECLNIFGPEYSLCEAGSFTEKEYRITSGMLVPIKILNEIGGYYTDFYVDGVDVELCYRAKEHGYKVYNVSGSMLEHHAGSNLHCKFLWHQFYSDGYSPKRIFGIIRNHLIIYKRFKIGKLERDYILHHYYIMMPIKIILGEKEKWSKLKSFIKGIYRGVVDSYIEINNIQ